jgi:hypothetical protein
MIGYVNEAESLTFSVLNGAAPPHQTPTPMEAESLTFSLLNGTAPPLVGTNTHEADSFTISLLNGSAPPVSPTVFEVDSLTFSVQNTATTAVNTKTQSQIIKVAQSKSNSKPKRPTPENTREEPPQPAETQRTGGANEMRR